MSDRVKTQWGVGAGGDCPLPAAGPRFESEDPSASCRLRPASDRRSPALLETHVDFRGCSEPPGIHDEYDPEILQKAGPTVFGQQILRVDG